MDFFKISSKYFSTNRQLLETTQTIPLLDETEEASIDLSDESIITFIKYVQHKKIQIDDDNVSSINYLSKKYEVSSLLSITNDYIAEHHQELALKILTVYQNNSKFDTSTYENILSEKLLYYIKNEQLLALKVPVLYRILEKYHKESKADDDRKEIFDFLLRCLQKYGREASPLFRFADFGSARSEYLNRLLTDYSEVFDSQFINSEMVNHFYEQQNEMIKINEESRILQEKTQKKLDDEIDAIRSEFEQKLQSSIDQMKKSIELKDKQIEDQKLQIMKLVNENNDIKSRLQDAENYVMKQKQTQTDAQQNNQQSPNESDNRAPNHSNNRGQNHGRGHGSNRGKGCGGNSKGGKPINVEINNQECSFLSKRMFFENPEDYLEVMQEDKESPLHPMQPFDVIIKDTHPMRAPILQAIDDLGFFQPSLIQSQAIPILNDEKKSLIAQGQSGSGKTVAFLVSMLLHVDGSKPFLQTICLCHTLELTMQNFKVFNNMNCYTKFEGDTCVKNDSNEEERAPSKTAQLLFGTPTSIIYWINKGVLDVKNVNFLVIDEADAILDKHSRVDRKIKPSIF